MNYVCARSVPDWHASSGMDISHSRVCKEMRALGLVRQTPAEGLPPAPVRAAAALFLGMHERLGAYSPVFLLDVPLLAYILDLYATIYAQLPGVDEFGDLAPWSKRFFPQTRTRTLPRGSPLHRAFPHSLRSLSLDCKCGACQCRLPDGAVASCTCRHACPQELKVRVERGVRVSWEG